MSHRRHHIQCDTNVTEEAHRNVTQEASAEWEIMVRKAHIVVLGKSVVGGTSSRTLMKVRQHNVTPVQVRCIYKSRGSL